MIEGFDKEMDALLRQTANSGTAFAAENSKFQIPNSKLIHLDADEISAFAENALPEKTRQRYTAHFADCDRCRKILSNTILTNSETETVPASPVVAPGIVAAASAPWYRRLFAFPNLAYTMGALVVLFGGFFAFTVLQNVNNSHSSDISQIPENQPTASGPNYDGEPAFSAADTTSNMSVATANSTSNAMMSNSTSFNMSTAATPTGAADNVPERKTNANLSAANTSSVKKESSLNESERADEKDLAQPKPAAPTTTDSTAGSVADDNQSVNSKQVAELPRDDDKAKITQAAPSPAAPENLALRSRNTSGLEAMRSKKSASNAGEARSVSGRNFTRKNGVWYDSNYKGQSTTNVRRGSNEYKNLDSDLRSIAESLSGTVVVVWKSRAYRIQ